MRKFFGILSRAGYLGMVLGIAMPLQADEEPTNIFGVFGGMSTAELVAQTGAMPHDAGGKGWFYDLPVPTEWSDVLGSMTVMRNDSCDVYALNATTPPLSEEVRDETVQRLIDLISSVYDMRYNYTRVGWGEGDEVISRVYYWELDPGEMTTFWPSALAVLAPPLRSVRLQNFISISQTRMNA